MLMPVHEVETLFFFSSSHFDIEQKQSEYSIYSWMTKGSHIVLKQQIEYLHPISPASVHLSAGLCKIYWSGFHEFYEKNKGPGMDQFIFETEKGLEGLYLIMFKATVNVGFFNWNLD